MSDDTDAKIIRCAIYTRKSTEEGLEQEFNSLDAQRESGEAYIAAQKHEGWTCVPSRYDDGGFTGGNMDRPALRRLLADIEDGKVDCILVYKVDRLSRSLIDFSRIMDVLERRHVSFVSVTQQFNTSTSMGRLMLNVLLSFAQFEREIISERTRDKIAAARRKGKWVGGRPILSYDIVSSPGGGRVAVNEDEAEQVRQIFKMYLKHQSLIPTVREVDRLGCPTYRLVRSKGTYNLVTEALDGLGLAGTHSATKFIPWSYLITSRHDRLCLLAGLIDSDGAATKSGIDYTTKSRELSADIVFLARSLGFWAKVTQKYSTCQTGEGGWFYRISMWGDFRDVPIRLARRRPTARQMNKCPLRTGFQIDPVGRGPYFGFMLDGDHLYVDGHFVVHHNSGKTPVIAAMCRDAVQQWGGRVLILAHVKELLEQAVDKLHAMAPDLWHQIGVYSAGLKSRDTEHPIIVAGIQSVYRRAAELNRFDLIVVDESHLIAPDGEGMYRTFLADAKVVNPSVRLIGLTATPYRMSTGMICSPENLLNHVCYEVGVRELIVQGYLCPLKRKAGKRKVDTSGLHIRGGEFVAGEVEALMDDDAVVSAACREIVEQTTAGGRHSVLIFAAGVQHAMHVQRILGELGHDCGFVCGETLPFERTETLKRFKDGELKYLVNVNVLTTGFDAPNIDCVVLLRPTNSPGLYYQMVGRSFRLHPSKTGSLVLDYGGNILRHGTVDALQIKDWSTGNNEAPAKECPACHEVIHAGYSVCPECGHEFPSSQRDQHDRQASTAGILSGEVTETEYEVQDTYFAVHEKRGASEDHPRSMRVDYRIAVNDYQSEWICFEHTGYARNKAEAWWKQRSSEPVPETAEEAVELAQTGCLTPTSAITVRSVAGEKYDRIVQHTLGDRPTLDLVGDPQYVPAEDDIPF